MSTSITENTPTLEYLSTAATWLKRASRDAGETLAEPVKVAAEFYEDYFDRAPEPRPTLAYSSPNTPQLNDQATVLSAGYLAWNYFSDPEPSAGE